MNDLKGVLRLTTTMFLLVGCFRLLAYAEETQEQQVERLIRELQDSDSDIRSIAAVTLGEMGPEAKDAVPALIQLLQDQDAEGFVRGNAARALGEIGSGAVDAVPVLIQALQDREVRGDAARTLGKIGIPIAIEVAKDTVPALIRTLKNGNVNVPFFAIWTLDVLRLMIVIGFIGVSGALIMTIWFGIVMWKHIVLRIEMGSDKGYHSSTKEDYSEYLGQTGVTLTVLRPAGTAMIDNKRLDVVSVDDFIGVDMPIQVVGVNGAKVTVEKSRQQTD